MGSNRQIYERLKQALELGLRRQVFLAVCDDLRLSYRLATGLARDLGTPDGLEPAVSYPRLVSLELMDGRNRQYSSKETNLIPQIEQWLGENPPPKRFGAPCFQVLGVEGLTRQSTGAQWSFLSELREIEASLREWDYSLLLWLPRPWCNSIARNAPEFWRSRTGVFEFEGEPTPTKKTGSKGAGEQGRRGAGETGSRGAGEQGSVGSVGSVGRKIASPSSPSSHPSPSPRPPVPPSSPSSHPSPSPHPPVSPSPRPPVPPPSPVPRPEVPPPAVGGKHLGTGGWGRGSGAGFGNFRAY
ncbi:hypothetical protein [[Phormidium] sp. ETS-05]|uniref:hypothetical protein n=1 Tax=[Phormidium] sp. ETS-05 TaxID=222819 RepID=UPI0018EF0DD6|nr:hypothetical protein [[Phormidium] sp. ETS-05]